MLYADHTDAARSPLRLDNHLSAAACSAHIPVWVACMRRVPGQTWSGGRHVGPWTTGTTEDHMCAL